MKKFDADYEVSTLIDGVVNWISIAIKVITFVGIPAFIALGFTDEDVPFAICAALIVHIPFLIIAKRLLKGYSKIVEAAENYNAYIDMKVNGQEENQDFTTQK